MVSCLEQGADLHMVQLMPLPLTISCSSKIQIGFTFLVPAHPGSHRQRAVKRVCVCVYCVQALAASNGVYRIRAAKGSDRDTHSNYVYSFVKAVSDDLNLVVLLSQ